MDKLIKTNLQRRLLRLAVASDGFGSNGVSGVTAERISATAELMVQAGLLWRGRSGTAVVRYFAGEPEALLFTAAERGKSQKSSASPRSRANWPKDAPMNITADTKITLAPAPPTDVLRSNTYSR
jgi:hypothetical protein